MPSEDPEIPATTIRADGAFDPVSSRDLHRMTTIYALETDAEALDQLDALDGVGEQASDALYFGRLAEHYARGASQLPTVLLNHKHTDCDVFPRRSKDSVEIHSFNTWLFQVPNGGLVAAFSIDVHGSLRDCIPLLEDCYYGDLMIDGMSPVEMIRKCAEDGPLAPVLADCSVASHGHQLLYVSRNSEDLIKPDKKTGERWIDHDLIRRLIYRVDTAYRADAGHLTFPTEANRAAHALAACGPYLSVFAGQQDYVENAAFLAAVQLVGSTALLGRVRARAFKALKDLSTLQSRVDDPNDPLGHRAARLQLAELSERVGRLELDLSFGIEAYHDVAAVIPSMRVADLHRELFDAAALPRQTQSINQMLDRLAKAVAAELASVLTTERSRDERRRLVWGVALGFASFIAIPLTLVFGFFAVATNNVKHTSSLLNFSRYHWFYATIAGVMLITLLLALGTWLLTRDRPSPSEPRPASERR